MRKTKRLVSLVLSVLMLIGLLPMATFSSSAAFNDPALKFDENGEFVFMQISDVQDDEEVDETTLSVIAKAVDRYNPKLAVFTGDNVGGGLIESRFKSSADQFLAPLINKGVRFAVTFGNHDSEGIAYSRQNQYNYYISKPYAIDYDEPGLNGVGTGAIPVYSHDGSRVAFCVFPADSGDYDSNGNYDRVENDQVAWYESEMIRLKALNNGNPVPTMVFQHIPVYEIYDTMLTQVSSGTAGSVRGTAAWGNNSYILNPSLSIDGVMKEGPCPSAIRGSQYQSWLTTNANGNGNMIGAFYGHDHTNTFVGADTNGIVQGYCKAATLKSYNDGDPGVRIFRVREDGTYTTQQVTVSSLAVEEAGEYEHDEVAGTPTVPNILYVGAADNSLSKQEFGSSIQLMSVNHKTQALYPNDLDITIDLGKAVTDVVLTPPAGINISSVTRTEKDENTYTYKWKILGGSASAGTVAEFTVSYVTAGTAMVQRAYSYVDNIKSPSGYYIFTRNYTTVNAAGYFCTDMGVITLLGDTAYGKARATTDAAYNDYSNWTNSQAGYYNYLGSGDGGFVDKGTDYGLNFVSPSRKWVENANYPRFMQAGKSTQTTVYVDTGEIDTLSQVGLSVNDWRWGAPDNNVTTSINLAFKSGDVGYDTGSWNTGTVAASVIRAESGATLANAKGSNANIRILGDSVPADGSVYTMIVKTQTNFSSRQNHGYYPISIKFRTYDKTALRALLNAERSEMRQAEGISASSYATYVSAFKAAYRQINKVDTDQASIDGAIAQLNNAITNLNGGGVEISDNAEYAANITVPSRIYVAGAGYGLAQQPLGTNIQPQIVNYQTGTMVNYTNFTVSVPDGSSIPNVSVTCTGGTVSFAWDPQTRTGEITGGSATVGSTIRYEFTYQLNGKQYTKVCASTVAAAPVASGYLSYIRRQYIDWGGTKKTAQEHVNFFTIAGVPAEGVGIITTETSPYVAQYPNDKNYGVNLTDYSSSGAQKVAGPGISDWTYPGRTGGDTWYCGKSADGNEDISYRGHFDIYMDPSVITNFSQVNLMYRLINVRNQSDCAQIEESDNVYIHAGNESVTARTPYAKLQYGAPSNGNAVVANTNGASYYRMVQGNGALPSHGDVVMFSFSHYSRNDGQLKLNYGWLTNMYISDKTTLRNAVAAEDEFFRQVSDGYDNSDGSFTNYLNALVAAKAAITDVTLSASANDTAVTNLENAVAQLKYLPADYSALAAKVASIRIPNPDPNTNQQSTYCYRPYPTNDPIYFDTGIFYPWSFYRSTNEVDIPIDNIDWNLDIRFQAQVDQLAEVLDVGWQSVYLNNADYTEVDHLLSYKTGVGPNDAFGGNMIRLSPVKYKRLDQAGSYVSYTNFTTESYQNWDDAAAAGSTNRSYKSPEQGLVDALAADLNTAYEGLTLKSADYSKLDEAINDASQNINTVVTVVNPADASTSYDIYYYDPAYVAQINELIALRQDGLYILEQEPINELADQIDELYIVLGNHLNAADYTFAFAQRDTQAQYESEYETYYTAESWAALVAARAAIKTGKMAGEQSVVNKYAKDIYDARNALAYNPASYTQVNYYLGLAADLTASDYANWSALQAAIDAVDLTLDITRQGEVDAMAEALEAAYTALQLKDADYSALEEQLEIAAAKLANEALFTPGSFTNLSDAYAAAQTVNNATPRYNIHQQQTVTDAANVLASAIAGLAYKNADIQPLDDAMTAYNAVDPYAYGDDAETIMAAADAAYAVAEDLMESYNAGELDIRNDAEILAAANALSAAIADLPASYQPVTDAIAEIPEDLTVYTTESVAALNNVLSGINYNLKLDQQDLIYTYADAIYEAIGNLEIKGANLTDLIAAITAASNRVNGIDTTWFTADSWAAYEGAYNAAVDIRDADPAYLITEQEAVNEAEEALLTATVALEYVDADYSDLEAAITDYNGLNLADYTLESVTASDVEAKAAAAQAVPAGLKINQQATIDTAADALEAAIAALEPIPAPTTVELIPAADSTTVIDTENGIIYGLIDGDYEELTDLVEQGYCEFEGDGYVVYEFVGNYKTLGTGAKVKVYRSSDDELIAEYTILIYGDNNGDGYVATEDLVDVMNFWTGNDSLYDYEDYTVPAVIAMDLDGNGYVDSYDFTYIFDYVVGNIEYIDQSGNGNHQ